jgi:hypothetical protein
MKTGKITFWVILYPLAIVRAVLVEKWQLSKAQCEREKSVQDTELTLVSKKGSMDIRFSIQLLIMNNSQ